MNYQYRFGTSFTSASKTLYQDGGLARYYAGLTAALVQGNLLTTRPPHVKSMLVTTVRLIPWTLYRAGCQIRRHCSQRWDPGIATVQLIHEKITFTRADCIRFNMVRYNVERSPQTAR